MLSMRSNIVRGQNGDLQMHNKHKSGSSAWMFSSARATQLLAHCVSITQDEFDFQRGITKPKHHTSQKHQKHVVKDFGYILLFHSTFPVVGPRSTKDNIVVIFSEGGSHTLLTGPEPFVPPGASITEFPVSSILIWLAVDAQVLTEHVTASSDVTCLLGCVCKQQALVSMGTRLREKGM